MIDTRTRVTLWGFSDLLQDAKAVIQENFSIARQEALATLEHLTNVGSRFEHLQTPAMPPKPEGTRFKTPPAPTAAELQSAGLSEESLPQFVRVIESVRETRPQTEGATSILRQIQDQGATVQQSSIVRRALAALEALSNLNR